MLRVLAAARQDVAGIWRYTAKTWGVAQADRYTDSIERAFEALGASPQIVRERTEFSPPVRIYQSGQHLIVYMTDDEDVIVVRVLGAKQNWQAILGNAD